MFGNCDERTRLSTTAATATCPRFAARLGVYRLASRVTSLDEYPLDDDVDEAVTDPDRLTPSLAAVVRADYAVGGPGRTFSGT